MNLTFLKIAFTSFLVLFLCSSATLTSQKESLPHLNPNELIEKMEDALGGKAKFYNMKDVQFDYIFEYTKAGKQDISQERMIFHGEHTYAKYSTHNAIVLPEEDGEVIHALVNGQPYVTHNEKAVTDEKQLKSCEGIRKANYYWFTMMYKLSDPGIILTSKDHEKIYGELYHKVLVEFDVEKVGKNDNDTYLLYINAKTNLVDRFHFAIPADASHEGVKILVEYETVRGLKLPAKRSAFMPDENGNYSTEPRLIQTSSNFKFKNNFTPENLIPG